MNALRFDGRRLVLDDIPPPKTAGEVVVRVVRSGICNTDLEIARGYAGFKGTIGHEFVGVVEDGAGGEFAEGSRVVGEINVGCGSCWRCDSGDPRHCARRTVLGIVGRDGCHAEFLTLPESNLLAVPENVTDEQAVFVEPLAAALAIREQVEIGKGTRVAVIGDGKLGILCAWALRPECQHLYLIGKHRSKLNMAEADGVETVNLDEVSKLDRSIDLVVEASGSESGVLTALSLLRPRGKLVLKSTFHGLSSWDASRIVVDEISVIGSRCGRFEPAIEMIRKGEVRVETLISEEYPLAKGLEAMETAGRKGVLKVLLRP